MGSLGAMQDFPLRIMRLMDHAEREHGTREIVCARADGSTHRTNWKQVGHDSRRLAQALERLGIKPGDMIRVATRRGTVELNSRQDDAIPDGVVFIPFAFFEAAANKLTNPALDPFGKIPEFKYCAARVEAIGPQREAAE